MNKAKFITLDNGLTILIYTDNSKSTNHVELYTFFGGNNGEYVDYNGNTRSIKPGTAHLLEHYICENTVEGNLLDNLRKYNILSCNGGTNNENTSYFFNTASKLISRPGANSPTATLTPPAPKSLHLTIFLENS